MALYYQIGLRHPRAEENTLQHGFLVVTSGDPFAAFDGENTTDSGIVLPKSSGSNPRDVLPAELYIRMAGAQPYWGVKDGPQLYLCNAHDDWIVTLKGSQPGFVKVAATAGTNNDVWTQLDPLFRQAEALQTDFERVSNNFRRRVLMRLTMETTGQFTPELVNHEASGILDRFERVVAHIEDELRGFLERWPHVTD